MYDQKRNLNVKMYAKLKNFKWTISILIVLISFSSINCNDASGDEVPEKSVEEGESVHIPCKQLSTANSIQWFKDGKTVLLDFSPAQRRHWNLTVENVAFVSIIKASMQDAGSWECWHYNKNSLVAKVKVLKLTVLRPPTPPVLILNGRSISSTANLPEYAINLFESSSSTKDNSEIKTDALISSTNSRLTLKEKHLITVDCLQLAWTAPKNPAHWFVGGINLTDQSQLYMEFLTEQQVYKVRSSLTFNVTKDMHRGHLVCQTESINYPDAQSMATTELDVQYSISTFSINRNPEFGYHVLAGMTLSLSCSVDANPPAQTKWIRDGDKNTANQSLASDNIVETSALNHAQLIFKEISEENSGWYKCVAEQPTFGHFESYGYYLQIRSDTNSSNNKKQLASSNQDNSKQSSTRIPNKNSNLYNYYHDQQSNNQQQPISNSNQRQSQPYTNDPNSNQNVGGSNTGSNYINPNTVPTTSNNNCDTPGKPMVVALNRTVNAYAGQEVIVAAVFCCEPKPRRVLWIHRHLALKPATSVASYTASQLFMASNSRNCYRSTFKIDNARKEDSGELIFLVSNLKGLDDAFIHLNVTGGASYLGEEDGAKLFKNFCHQKTC